MLKKSLKSFALLSLTVAVSTAFAKIDVGSGNKTIVENDYVYQSNQPLAFNRYYSNAFKNWRFEFEDMASYSNVNNIEVITVNLANFENYVIRRTNGVWNRVSGSSKIKFQVIGGNDVKIILPNGTVKFFKNNYSFLDNTSSFRLKTITLKNGQFFNIDYPSENVKTITDSYGRVFTINYESINSDKRVSSFVGVGGKTINYVYSSGNLDKVIYPDSSFIQYTRSSLGITKITDENGSVYKNFAYTNYNSNAAGAQNGLKGTAEGLGNNGLVDKISLSYSVVNKVTLTDSLNNKTVINNQKVGNDYKITGYESICTFCNGIQGASLTYDANGLIDSVVDFKNSTTKYTWNDSGQPLTITEGFGTPLQRTTTNTYNASGSVTSKTEPVSGGNKVTNFTYNSEGLLTNVTVTAPKNNGTSSTTSKNLTFIYNDDELIEVRGANYLNNSSDKTTMTYNTNGQLATITNALGHVTTYDLYDDYGNPSQVTLPNGSVVLATYDLRGRLLTTTFKSSLLSNDAETTSYTYDLAGQVIRITNPSGSYSKMTYDTAHRLISIEDWKEPDSNSPEGIFEAKVEYVLDNMSNITSIKVYDKTNTQVRATTNQYDSKNRLFKTIGSLNQTTTYTYDGNSNLSQITDAGNYSFGKAYDVLNRVVSMTNPDNAQIGMSYNADDTVASVTDPKGLITSYKYDGFGNVIEQTSPDTGITKYEYDLNSNLKSMTNAKGQVTNYTYDVLNRIKNISYVNHTNENVTMNYDTCMVGKLCSIQDENGTITYGYNGKGKLVNKNMNHNITGSNNNIFNKNVSYEYDSIGRLSYIVYPNGNKVGYDYDNDKVVAVTYTNATTNNKVDVISEIEYGPFESLEKSYKWNNSNQDVHNKSVNIDGVVTEISNSQTDSYAKTFGYDSRFNITNINGLLNNTQNSISSNVTYDNKSRVTGFGFSEVKNGVQTTKAYGYGYNTSDDRLSNVKPSGTVNYNYDINSHKLTGLSGATNDSFTYDLNGNMQATNEYSFEYNAANRLVKSTSASGVTTYNYNAYGQRVRKQTISGSNVKTTWFVYEGTNLMYEETQENSNSPIKIEYIYLNGKLVGLVKDNQRYQVQTDQIGTPRVIINESGSIVWKWENEEAFGNNEPVENGLKFNLRFAGQYYDEEKGTSYNMNRDYAAGLGRYIQSDPIGLDGGINTYGYVEGNPLSFIDPEGLDMNISRSGNTININVPISIKTKGSVNIDFLKSIKGKENIINSFWNLKKFKYNGCNIVFNISFSEGQNELNEIVIYDKSFSGRSVVNNGNQIEMYERTHINEIVTKKVYYYTIAHEVGHLMGLKDRYIQSHDGKVSTSNKEWEGNIMGSSITKNGNLLWDPDQRNINEIMSVNRINCMCN